LLFLTARPTGLRILEANHQLRDNTFVDSAATLSEWFAQSASASHPYHFFLPFSTTLF
jgi:hypothetical protein